MTTLRHIRTSVGRLAHVEASQDEAGWSWAVQRRVFARVSGPRGSEELHVRLDDGEAASRVSEVPGARLAADGTEVVVALDAVNGMVTNSLLNAAHAAVVPSGLVPERVPSDQINLPAIGRPATQALIGHGLHDLAAVARCPRDEVAALHGVGPRALAILDEGLAAAGHAWA